MAKDALAEKLDKAAGNLRKVSEFFAARRSWPLAVEAERPLGDFAAAAAATRERIRQMIDGSGAKPLAATDPTAPALAAGVLDAGRLTTFTTFLRDLDGWLAAQPGPFGEIERIVALQSMEVSLGATIRLVASRTAPVDVTPASAPPATDAVTAEPADSAEPAEHAEPVQPTGEIPDDGPQNLVLDDTEATPLVQEFQGIHELTPQCEQQVDEFLAAWDIKYSHYNRKKFLERLLRWISSAPHGQVLVLKITTAQGAPEPYPAYVSREVLKGNTPEPTF